MTTNDSLSVIGSELSKTLGPQANAAIRSATNGVQVRKRPVEIVAGEENFSGRVPGEKLIVRFAGRRDKFEFDAANVDRLTFAFEEVRWIGVVRRCENSAAAFGITNRRDTVIDPLLGRQFESGLPSAPKSLNSQVARRPMERASLPKFSCAQICGRSSPRNAAAPPV